MSLEELSRELKNFVSVYEAQWFLGELSGLMKHIPSGRAEDQLGKLSSPLRQLYYLGGLLITSNNTENKKVQYTKDEWNRIVKLLNEIEQEYSKLFFPEEGEEIDDEWKKVRKVAMPSFLSYFNQGPLNYEEQSINWIRKMFSDFDDTIETKSDLKTEDFLRFYENLDSLVQRNFQGFTSTHVDLRPNWEDYACFSLVENPDVPEHIREEMNDMFEARRPFMHFMADHGLINRFYPEELTSENLTLDQVKKILSKLSCSRSETDFLYYTSTDPSNPLYEKPIVSLEDGIYQVFEVKQVLHAIDDHLESICSNNDIDKYVEKKGKLLETLIVELFEKFFKKDYRIFTSYYVDGNEQDILILWKNYAFIIEAKGYNLREPLRDPDRAFVRIKDDFKDCIGYGYQQTNRVEEKFLSQEPLRIEDKNGNLIEEIDTKKYESNDFSIIVNLNSFGQIQNDLSTLLEIEDDHVFPWVVKYDDLEVFILTLIAKNKSPHFFVSYLLLREDLHGKLICSDELEICGGFILGRIKKSDIPDDNGMILTTPDLASVFDDQYYEEMGFENEKYLEEKRSGDYIIL